MASTGSLRNVKGTEKKYGLIMPVKSNKVNISFGKNKKTSLNSKPIKVNPLFSELNDEEDDNDDNNLSSLASSRKNINLELRNMTRNASKQVEAEYKKAMEEDPSIYDYDEVYDSMKRDELARKKGNQSKEEKKKVIIKYTFTNIYIFSIFKNFKCIRYKTFRI